MAAAAHSIANDTPHRISPDVTERLRAIRAEHEAKEMAETRSKRVRFEAMVAEWYENQAAMKISLDDDEMNRRDCRDAELARLITTTPSPVPFCVDYKIMLIEHYLDGDEFTDNRLMVMFAGLKADLKRFEITER